MYNVVLIDIDVYALPTVRTYISQEQRYWINNFLFNTSTSENIIYDLIPLSRNSLSRNFLTTKEFKKAEGGKFLVAFSISSKEE